MKKLVLAVAIGLGLFAYAQAAKTKVVCAIGEVDSIFTEEFPTMEECRKYCKGTAAVCQRTGINTNINLRYVD